MEACALETHLFYMHTEEEVAELAAAVIPMRDSIAAVASSNERHHMHRIIEGKHFRLKHAKSMRAMLLRACKYTKLHLGEYFPILQHDVLVNVQRLEDAVDAYWLNFKELRQQTIAMP
jgi:hypothetical protein